MTALTIFVALAFAAVAFAAVVLHRRDRALCPQRPNLPELAMVGLFWPFAFLAGVLFVIAASAYLLAPWRRS